VATRLLTHTQVLDDETSILTDATPAAFAQGILDVITNPGRGQEVGRNAQQLAETKYSYEAYLERTKRAYGLLEPLNHRTLEPIEP
jgi:glycosyltransferase involved in cell wall biosynthesis